MVAKTLASRPLNDQLEASSSRCTHSDESDLDELSHRSSNRRLDNNEVPSITRLNATHRRAQFLSILPITSTEEIGNVTVRSPIPYRTYNEASAWLAWWHLTEPERHIIPGLRDRLQGCDISFGLEFRDSRFSALNAGRELLDAFAPKVERTEDTSLVGSSSEADDEHTIPTALIGSARSAVSIALSFLGSAYELPQISSSSTSTALENKDSHQFFARTVPSNSGDARAMAIYFKNLGVAQIGVLYIADSFGTNYHADLVNEATLLSIKVESASYSDGEGESAIQQLADKGVRYIVGIVNPSTWRPLFRFAIQYGIMGTPGYTWFLTESSSELLQPSFELDREADIDLIQAVNGAGVLVIDIPTYEPFDTALLDFSLSEEQQRRFISQHREPTIFDDFAFPDPGGSLYQYLTYDAVMALGVASCEAEGEEVRGRELYEQLVRTEFTGVSGPVSFLKTTGTRQGEDFAYRLYNLVISDESFNQTVRFDSRVSARVDLRRVAGQGKIDHVGDAVEVLSDFIYANNSTKPPPDLPEVAVDMNLIPPSARAVGLSMCAAVMFTSVFFMIWTWYFRKKDVVRASQPIFLIQLCLGTVLMASTIIPLSIQEPTSQRGMDMACMATPWLFSIGFVTAFSALFSKTWRLNKLFNNGQIMRRIIVRPQDVMLPFVFLMVSNIGLLIVWTVVHPMKWRRIPVGNYDEFGRSVESFGTCSADFSKIAVYLIPIFVIDVSALVVANYQCYKARNLPTDFSESGYVAFSMASLLETVILAVPLLYLAADNPTSSFLIRSILISIFCLTILLPVFLPKWVQRNRNGKHRMTRMPSVDVDSSRQIVSRAGSRGQVILSAAAEGSFRHGKDGKGEERPRKQKQSVVSLPVMFGPTPTGTSGGTKIMRSNKGKLRSLSNPPSGETTL